MPSGPKGQRPIDERIHDVLAGRADPEDEQAVREWWAAGADNERTFRMCGRVFGIERALRRRIDVGDPPDVRDVVLLAEAREAARKLAGSPRNRAGRGWWRAWLATAAALSVAAGGAALYRTVAPAETQLHVDMFLAGDDDPVTMRLSDGSIVRLAPGGQIRLLPGSGRRMVELDGRAYFAIPRDPERPFVVRTRAGDVRVLGTRFQAEAAGDSTRVLVIEGQVALSGIAQEARIEASQLGRLRGGRVEPVIAVPDVGPMLDWIGNFVVFQATPLEAAMTEIADRYGVRFEILDESYARRDLTMWFAGQPVDEILDVICAVLGARCRIDSDLIRIGA